MWPYCSTMPVRHCKCQRSQLKSRLNSPSHTEMRLVLHSPLPRSLVTSDRQYRYIKYLNSYLNPTTKAGSVTASRKVLRIFFFAGLLITRLQSVKKSSLNFYLIHLESLSILHSHLRLGCANVLNLGEKIFLLILIYQRATYPVHLTILDLVFVLVRGLIQNIPDWCRHLYGSRGSAKHR
jgi:hypothetical protein